MLINKRAIYILFIASILSICWSILSFKISDENWMIWNQGVAFGVLGSSLVTLFCAIINYKTEKKKCIEDISYKLAHMSNDTHMQFYNSNTQTLEQIAATIGSCTKHCFEIQNLLREYYEGLFFYSSEKEKIESIGKKIYIKYECELFALGSILKENKELAKKNINYITKKLHLLLKDNEIFELIYSILKKNKSVMRLESVDENDAINFYKSINISNMQSLNEESNGDD